ncbi:hypothetical protein AV530_006940 [Patagioenas fasciata monilis]|uniref:Uncharacterized protein n=1 Tax=Patagioenas fasciata monilis TaxID=372326 RepID=A0A1V4KY10_PATFA|nr:hypothetical protein AV530_006940 [Patagioenas fasciata monilis]
MKTAKTIIYSVWSEEDFLEMDVPPPSDPSVDGHEDEQGAVEPVPGTYVAGLQPQVWAGLFRDSVEILEPLVFWVNEVLQGPFWWEVAVAQGTIIATLCHYGLDKEALVRELQPFLQDQTETFVRQLIDVAAERCSEQILRQLELLEPRDMTPMNPKGLKFFCERTFELLWYHQEEKENEELCSGRDR